MHKIKKIILTALSIAFLGLGISAIASAPAFAACEPVSGNPIDNILGGVKCSNPGEETPLMTYVQRIINVVLFIIGIVAVIIIIYAAVQYVLSAGDSGKAKNAKNTILYAVVGLAIALLAYAIVNFTINALTASANPDTSDQDTSDPITDPAANPYSSGTREWYGWEWDNKTPANVSAPGDPCLSFATIGDREGWIQCKSGGHFSE